MHEQHNTHCIILIDKYCCGKNYDWSGLVILIHINALGYRDFPNVSQYNVATYVSVSTF